jgi:hypothetical protein
VDGLRAAPIDVLATGAAWRWTGEALRLDGAAGVMLLEGAEGAAELRARAARTVQRLMGAALGSGQVPRSGADAAPDRGFVLTDGRARFDASVIEVAGSPSRLVMFIGEMPPADRDLWVVHSTLPRGQSQPEPAPGGMICFTPGTMLRVGTTAVPIESLRPGDRIQTRDNGLQEVLWTGSRRMSGARLYAMPHLRPVRFRAGALGIGQPDRDLCVSPRHRMLVKGSAARALFNEDEVLVAAEDLLNGGTIAVDLVAREVTYVHVLLERHEVIWANGLASESFHPAAASLESLDPHDRFALEAILPEIAGDPDSYGDFARRCLTASEAAILRHDLAA